MAKSTLDVTTALLKHKKMCHGSDFFGFGPSVFINDQSVGIILEVDIGDNKKIYICDLKTHGYPSKNFVDTYHLLGGSWINPNHKTPFDVMKTELTEEIGNAKLVKAIVDQMHPFADYIISVPKKVHGNNNHSADFHITVSSIFISSLAKHQIEQALDVSLAGSSENIVKKLFILLKPIFNESEPGIFAIQDIQGGKCKRFCWGHDIVLSDYFYENYNVRVTVPGFVGIITDRMISSPSTPFADRLETKHTRLNPLKLGLIDDDFSYKPET